MVEASQEEYLNTAEVCQILGLSQVSTLYDYIHHHGLKATKLGGNRKRGHFRIKKSDLFQWMEDNAVKR